MPGRYDITPLDTSTRQKMLGNYQEIANAILSDQDIDALMGRYGLMEDEALDEAFRASQLELSRAVAPEMEALRARNFGIYSGGGAGRDYSRIMADSLGQLTGRRMELGGESAARKAAFLRSLAQQRISGRQGLGEQLWGRMLSAKKRPSTGQQLASAGLQIGGAVGGALIGGPGGAAAGGGSQEYEDFIQSPQNVDWYERQGLDQLRNTPTRPLYNTTPIRSPRRNAY